MSIIFQEILTNIEVHGKLLKLLLSICKVLAEDDLVDDDDQAIRRVKYLETVWHGVWLRAMEWECLIEQSLARKMDEVSCGEYLFLNYLYLYFRGVIVWMIAGRTF